MKTRDLKNIITEAFECDAPDLRARIIASCEKEAQLPALDAEIKPEKRSSRLPQRSVIFKWAAACAACLVLFVSGLLTGLLIPDGEGDPIPPAEAAAFVYLDVNPSVELRVDSENNVLECLAANDDAEELLSGLKLCGVDMNTALTAITGAMYVNGYLSTESNSILVSVDASDDEATSALLTDITENINNVFEKSTLECSVIAQGVKVNDELKQRAEENGVSVGKMHFVDKVISEMGAFSDEDVSDLVNMSIKDLNSMYSEKPGSDKPVDGKPDGDTPDGDTPGDGTPDDGNTDDTPGGDDTPSGNDPSGDEPGTGDGNQGNHRGVLAWLLMRIDADMEDVEWYEVKEEPSDNSGFRWPVYLVSIRFKGDDTICEYRMDCNTGKVDVINGKA